MIWRSRQHILRDRDVPLLPRYDLIGGGQRQQPLAVRDLPQGLHQNLERHIFQNDTVGTGGGRHNQFTVLNRCGEKNQPRGKTPGVSDGEDFQPGQARHRYVEDGNVRHQTPNRFDAARTAARNNFETALCPREARQTLRQDGGQQSPRWCNARAVLGLSPSFNP